MINYIGMIHSNFTVYLLIELFSSHSSLASVFLFKFYISWCKTKPIWLFLPYCSFHNKLLVTLRSVRCSKLICHPITTIKLLITLCEHHSAWKTTEMAASCMEKQNSKEERFLSLSSLHIWVHMASDNII